MEAIQDAQRVSGFVAPENGRARVEVGRTVAWRAAWFAVDTRFASVHGEFGFVCV